MHILFDNLTAAIIAMTLFLMILTVNIRTQQSLTETGSFNAMMKQGENFTQILRRDLQGVAAPQSVYGDKGTAFSFMGLIGTNTTPDSISYEPVHDGDTLYYYDGDGNATTVPVYRIVRYVNGEEAGGSSDVIVEWDIQCRDGKDSLVTQLTLSECSRIAVTFAAAPRIGDPNVVPRMNWSTVFHPPLLQFEYN